MTKDQLEQRFVQHPEILYPGQHLIALISQEGSAEWIGIIVEKINDDGTITGRRPIYGNLLHVPQDDLRSY